MRYQCITIFLLLFDASVGVSENKAPKEKNSDDGRKKGAAGSKEDGTIQQLMQPKNEHPEMEPREVLTYHPSLDKLPLWSTNSGSNERNSYFEFDAAACHQGKAIKYSYSELFELVNGTHGRRLEKDEANLSPQNMPDCELSQSISFRGKTSTEYETGKQNGTLNFVIGSAQVCDGIGASVLRQLRGLLIAKLNGVDFEFHLPFCGKKSTLNYPGIYCHYSGMHNSGKEFGESSGYFPKSGTAGLTKEMERKSRQAFSCYQENMEQWFPFALEFKPPPDAQPLCKVPISSKDKLQSHLTRSIALEALGDLRRLFFSAARRPPGPAPNCNYYRGPRPEEGGAPAPAAAAAPVHVGVHIRLGDVREAARGQGSRAALFRAVELMAGLARGLGRGRGRGGLGRPARFHVYTESLAAFTGRFQYLSAAFEFFRVPVAAAEGRAGGGGGGGGGAAKAAKAPPPCAPHHFVARARNPRLRGVLGPVHFVLNNSPFHALYCLAQADALLLTGSSNFGWLATALADPRAPKVVPAHYQDHKAHRSFPSLGQRNHALFTSMRYLNLVPPEQVEVWGKEGGEGGGGENGKLPTALDLLEELVLERQGGQQHNVTSS